LVAEIAWQVSQASLDGVQLSHFRQVAQGWFLISCRCGSGRPVPLRIERAADIDGVNVMKTWIRAAILTIALAVGDPVGTASAAEAPSKLTTQMTYSSATDFNARRDRRHGHRSHYRPQPTYYARPYYYRPYPYSVPAPFTFGFAFAPRW
jgi:hypothetical protein